MTNHSTAGTFSRPNERIRLRLNGPSTTFDPRCAAIRGDLADVDEAVRHLAPHYAAGVTHVCAVPFAAIRADGHADASAVSELLLGERFHVLDIRGGWAWGYCAHDHYVGYVAVSALVNGTTPPPTHRVIGPAAPLFARPDIKAPVQAVLSAGALVRGEGAGDFLATPRGYLHHRHVVTTDIAEVDRIAVARRYLGLPYVWGGRGGAGIDCSGLVQAVLGACGHAVPRDSDQQAGVIGTALDGAAAGGAGDLVFFPGHVGILTGGDRLLHANAYWMRVVEEPLADVVARARPLHAAPILARRRLA